MFDLALNYGSGPVALKTVAERQKLPEPYLEQIVIGLRKARLLRGVRGAQGGYILTRPPEKITVGDVIRALESAITPTNCVGDGDGQECELAGFCPSRAVWAKIGESINNAMDGITLADMIEDYRGMCPSVTLLSAEEK
jgi:Rrf2 family protein